MAEQKYVQSNIILAHGGSFVMSWPEKASCGTLEECLSFATWQFTNMIAYAQTTGEKEYLSWFPITIGGPHA